MMEEINVEKIMEIVNRNLEGTTITLKHLLLLSEADTVNKILDILQML